MQRTNLNKESCPLARGLDVIGEWWSLLILREAFAGVRRFDDFHLNLGIPRNTLTQRLTKLVEFGILEKRLVSEKARRHEYALTPIGVELLPALILIREWSTRHLFKPNEKCVRLVDARDQSDVSIQTKLVSKKGKPVRLQDLQLITPK